MHIGGGTQRWNVHSAEQTVLMVCEEEISQFFILGTDKDTVGKLKLETN